MYDKESTTTKYYSHLIKIPPPLNHLYNITIFDLESVPNSDFTFNLDYSLVKQQQCKQNCAGSIQNLESGLCLQGKCICQQNYAGEACQVPVINALINDKQQMFVKGKSWQYFQIHNIDIKKKATYNIQVTFKESVNFIGAVTLNGQSEVNIPNFYIEKTQITSDSYLFQIDQKELEQYVSYLNGKDVIPIIYVGLFNNELKGQEIELHTAANFNSLSGTTFQLMIFIPICIVLLCLILITTLRLVQWCKKRKQQHMEIHPSEANENVNNLLPEIYDQYMPIINYTEALQEYPDLKEVDECIICLKDFVDDKQIRLTVCFHIYHNECIEKWWQQQDFCPQCRQNLQEPEIKKILDGNQKNPYIQKIHSNSTSQQIFRKRTLTNTSYQKNNLSKSAQVGLLQLPKNQLKYKRSQRTASQTNNSTEQFNLSQNQFDPTIIIDNSKILNTSCNLNCSQLPTDMEDIQLQRYQSKESNSNMIGGGGTSQILQNFNQSGFTSNEISPTKKTRSQKMEIQTNTISNFNVFGSQQQEGSSVKKKKKKKKKKKQQDNAKSASPIIKRQSKEQIQLQTNIQRLSQNLKEQENQLKKSSRKSILLEPIQEKDENKLKPVKAFSNNDSQNFGKFTIKLIPSVSEIQLNENQNKVEQSDSDSEYELENQLQLHKNSSLTINEPGNQNQQQIQQNNNSISNQKINFPMISIQESNDDILESQKQYKKKNNKENEKTKLEIESKKNKKYTDDLDIDDQNIQIENEFIMQEQTIKYSYEESINTNDEIKNNNQQQQQQQQQIASPFKKSQQLYNNKKLNKKQSTGSSIEMDFVDLNQDLKNQLQFSSDSDSNDIQQQNQNNKQMQQKILNNENFNLNLKQQEQINKNIQENKNNNIQNIQQNEQFTNKNKNNKIQNKKSDDIISIINDDLQIQQNQKNNTEQIQLPKVEKQQQILISTNNLISNLDDEEEEKQIQNQKNTKLYKSYKERLMKRKQKLSDNLDINIDNLNQNVQQSQDYVNQLDNEINQFYLEDF